MTKTYPIVDFSVYDPAIKQDSTPSASSIQSFSKIDDLEKPNTNTAYATFEPNLWLLNGSYKLMPSDTTNVHTGWMSQAMSGSDGVFSSAPVLTIVFGSVQSIDGLTLNFSQHTGDWATDIDVSFYDALNVLIQTDTYTPTTWEIYTAEAVANFKKIVITFNETNKPYRYLRLQSIDYGQVIHFDDADIKSCKVIEQIDPLSITLPIGTLELSVFSSDAAFSIIDPTGLYSDLQYRQPFDVYELVGNDQIYIGHFYLDTWENPSDNEIIFKCIDTIGLLDTIPYIGEYYDAAVLETAGDLIDNILSEINIPYMLDTSLITAQIAGWIPPCSYREALQLISFSIGAYVVCARSGVLQIVPTVLASDLTSFNYSITKAEKGINQTLTLNPLITEVEVTAHYFSSKDELTESKIIYKEELEAGTYTVIFDEPIWDAIVTGASIVGGTWHYNYMVIEVATPGTVEIVGTGFNNSKTITRVDTAGISASVKKNLVKIDEIYLVSRMNVDEISQRVYDYFQMRYLQKMKLYVPEVKVGDSVLIDTLQNGQLGAIVEKMTLDLSGGFTAEVEATGVVIPL